MKHRQLDLAANGALAPSPAGESLQVAAPCSLLAAVARAAAMITVTLGIASAQIGANYCMPAPNSTGATASIAASGSAALSLNNLALTSSNLPPNVAAYFLCSRTQGYVANPGGSAGNLCLGNSIGRAVGSVITSSGATGSVRVTADLSALPQPIGAVVVMPGEVWNFQCWYRDSAAGGQPTSNFSAGLRVRFSATLPIPALVPIPAGTFLMGSAAANGPPYFGPYGPVHQVTISSPFWMGRYEVTQDEYRALMGVNPAYIPGATRPVEMVTWNQARAYCAALTIQEAGNIPAGFEYRLPTEAEWEYACRAGTTTEYFFGTDLVCDQARFGFSEHSSSYCVHSNSAQPVGSYTPNSFGLYDMHGNVWEWCLDSWAPYPSASVTDPFVTGGTSRVYRGGAWNGNSSYCRSALRTSHDPAFSNYAVGFRVVLAPVLVP